MKTKLMVLALLAGGSMFAQTRFSVGVSVGDNRGYYQQTAPVYAPAYVAPGPYNSYEAPRYDERHDRSWNQRYSRVYRGHDRDDDRGYSNGFRDRR